MFFPFVSIGENSKFVFRIKERETLACHRDDAKRRCTIISISISTVIIIIIITPRQTTHTLPGNPRTL